MRRNGRGVLVTLEASHTGRDCAGSARQSGPSERDTRSRILRRHACPDARESCRRLQLHRRPSSVSADPGLLDAVGGIHIQARSSFSMTSAGRPAWFRHGRFCVPTDRLTLVVDLDHLGVCLTDPAPVVVFRSLRLHRGAQQPSSRATFNLAVYGFSSPLASSLAGCRGIALPRAWALDRANRNGIWSGLLKRGSRSGCSQSPGYPLVLVKRTVGRVGPVPSCGGTGRSGERFAAQLKSLPAARCAARRTAGSGDRSSRAAGPVGASRTAVPLETHEPTSSSWRRTDGTASG